jgi:hypothetical protein
MKASQPAGVQQTISFVTSIEASQGATLTVALQTFEQPLASTTLAV